MDGLCFRQREVFFVVDVTQRWGGWKEGQTVDFLIFFFNVAGLDESSRQGQNAKINKSTLHNLNDQRD